MGVLPRDHLSWISVSRLGSYVLYYQIKRSPRRSPKNRVSLMLMWTFDKTKTSFWPCLRHGSLTCLLPFAPAQAMLHRNLRADTKATAIIGDKTCTCPHIHPSFSQGS